jgi:hypothetical protein
MTFELQPDGAQEAEISLDFMLGPDWVSRWIAWFGQGPNGLSHCASVIKHAPVGKLYAAGEAYIDARNDKLGTVPPGIHLRDPRTEQWIKKIRATKRVSQAVYNEWELNLRAKIGDKYARGDIVGQITGRMMHVSGTYDCSALLINELQHVKLVVLPLPIPPHQITPNAALLIVAQAGFTIGKPVIRTKAQARSA